MYLSLCPGIHCVEVKCVRVSVPVNTWLLIYTPWLTLHMHKLIQVKLPEVRNTPANRRLRHGGVLKLWQLLLDIGGRRLILFRCLVLVGTLRFSFKAPQRKHLKKFPRK